MTHRAVKPHVHVPYDSIDNYLEFIKEEKLNLEIYFGSRRFDDLDESAIRRLKQKLDYNPELTIHAPFMDLSPGAVDSKVRDVTIRRFTDIIRFSEILKPRAVVFHSGYDKWKYDSRVDIWLEGSLITWGVVNKMASDAGIKIAIENIFEKEPSSLRLLMEEMNSGNFGICFDAGHFNLFSETPLQEWISALKPYIIELHLHDNDRTADLHHAIGDGTFDFELLFEGLSGRECIYTIESHTIEDVRKSMLRLNDYLCSDTLIL
ncbi:MAG: sugar phosphate isomerase/epimerase [Nitrospirae bacterium]|nr:sugar phosphate isomerase/epimerase [Nitrospirota bacterium]